MQWQQRLGMIAVIGGLVSMGAADCDPVLTALFTPGAGTPSGHAGYAVALSEGMAVIGAPDAFEGRGAFFFARLNETGWETPERIVSPTLEEGGSYGSAVAVSSDWLIVGMPGMSTNNITGSGAAWMYRFDGAGWQREGWLAASDPERYDALGQAVAISGTTVVVGAPRNDDNGTNSGSAYVYEFDGEFWIRRQKLLASDGEAYDAFGTSVSIDGDTIVVGAPETNDNGTASGAVYVFTRTDGLWSEEQKITPAGGGSADFFGASVGLSGSVLVAGADWDDDLGSNAGAAYIFARDESGWSERAKLTASDGGGSEQFGHSVAIDGGLVVIGADEARGPIGQADAGAAYLFRFDGVGWVQDAKLVSDDPSAGAYFGNAVAVGGGRAMVGAWKEDGLSTESGAAYLFDLGCVCPADFNADGVLDIFDVFAFLDAYTTGDAGADFTGNGILDIFDVFAYLGQYQVGCP